MSECFLWLFVYHLDCPSDQPGVKFPLAVTSWDVGYGPMDRMPLNNICNCSHKNIRLLEDGLIAFPFKLLVYNSFPQKTFCLAYSIS